MDWTVFGLHAPAPETIEDLLVAQSGLPFSYADVGAIEVGPPPGYVVDHNRARLGFGAVTFQRAVAAVRRWEMFNLGWTRVAPAGAPIEVGVTVAVVARLPLLWSVNVCRILAVVDTPGPTARYGFTYGTLPEHAEAGEERFLVEWRADDDSVWYDILAFSKPNAPLARLAYPIGRLMQRRFARASLKAMRRAAAGRPGPA